VGRKRGIFFSPDDKLLGQLKLARSCDRRVRVTTTASDAGSASGVPIVEEMIVSVIHGDERNFTSEENCVHQNVAARLK
jgi:hypothetical protein